MASIWDDPDVIGGKSEYVQFNKVGDGVSGVITALGKKTWDDGSVSPQLDITSDEGEERILTAGQVQLKNALAEERPEVGDHISVHLTEIEKRGTKTLKHFDVVVKRAASATASKAAPAAADDDDIPF